MYGAKRKFYLSNPNVCPHCKSDELICSELQIDDNGGISGTRNIECSNCKKTWTEELRMVITNIVFNDENGCPISEDVEEDDNEIDECLGCIHNGEPTCCGNNPDNCYE